MITQSINLNLIPGGIPQRIKASQYDDSSRTLVFTLYNGTQKFTDTGVTAEIRGTKPDGKGFAYGVEDDVIYDEGVVTCDIKLQMVAVAGEVDCELVLYKGTGDDAEILGTANFVLDVEKAALGKDTDISETEIPAIIDAATASAEAAALSASAAATSETNAATSATNASNSATAASASEASANTSALKSEGFAVGEQAGVPVSSGVYYQNNSKYYREQAGLSATSASNDAASADISAETAEAFGAGTKDGQDVPSTSPAYHNNAKYYAEIAAQAAQQFTDGVVYKGNTLFANIPTSGMKNGWMYNVTDDFTTDNRFSEGAGIFCIAGQNIVWNDNTGKWDLAARGGVASFNGRYGAITPASGDYTAAMVGAVSKSGDTMTGALDVESNITADGEITDGGGNVLSDKYDATSLTFPNERFTISASGWSSTQTGGYYTYTLSTGNTKYNTYCPVFMDKTGVNDSTDPTSAEEAAYALVDKFDMANGTGVNSFTLYAKTKPTTTFYIKLSGQYMAKNAASSSKALDITTGCELATQSVCYTANGLVGENIPFDGSAERILKFIEDIIHIDSTEWSSTVNANGYYTCSKTLHAEFSQYSRPKISLIGYYKFDTSNMYNLIPSATAIAAYDLIDFFDVSGTTITAYAKTKPTHSLNINISGIRIA